MMGEAPRAFTHEHNARKVAEQEYELAKEYHRQVLLRRDPFNPDHRRRFRDAQERLEAARERYVEMLTGGR